MFKKFVSCLLFFIFISVCSVASATNNYTYSRDLIDGMWNIDNSDRVDEEGYQIHLSKEVSDEFVDDIFLLKCKANVAVFKFEEPLTSEKKTQLDGLVLAHKNNT